MRCAIGCGHDSLIACCLEVRHANPVPPIGGVSGAELMASCVLLAERMKLFGTPDELASMKPVQAKLEACGR